VGKPATTATPLLFRAAFTMERIARIAGHVLAGEGTAPSAGGVRPSATAAAAPSAIVATLKGKIAALAKERTALKAELLKVGDTKIQDVTVEMAINGARSMKTMVTETSDLDANKGIAYRGKSLFECNKELPKAPGGEAALPEAAFWLLLTGEVPTDAEVKALTAELHARSALPQNVLATLNTLPKDTHPMTQLSVCMLALQKDSKFAAKYDEGMKKAEYWEWALEDALDLVAKIPVVAAHIYRRNFKDGTAPAYNADLDWAGNYAAMLGVNDSEEFKEVTRLYLCCTPTTRAATSPPTPPTSWAPP